MLPFSPRAQVEDQDLERQLQSRTTDDLGWMTSLVAEAPWSVAEWAVALRFDNPRASVLVLVLG